MLYKVLYIPFTIRKNSKIRMKFDYSRVQISVNLKFRAAAPFELSEAEGAKQQLFSVLLASRGIQFSFPDQIVTSDSESTYNFLSREAFFLTRLFSFVHPGRENSFHSLGWFYPIYESKIDLVAGWDAVFSLKGSFCPRLKPEISKTNYQLLNFSLNLSPFLFAYLVFLQ